MPSHDVLIIGAGLAGQRAALEAARSGATVAIMSKVHPVRSHSNAAAGGINAALNPDDSWESHAFDTVKGSDYLGDQDAIEIMAREAPNEIIHLEHIGVTFHRNDEGELGTRAFGGASQARTYYVADITGQAILHVLYEQIMKYADRVDSYEEWFAQHDAEWAAVVDDTGRLLGLAERARVEAAISAGQPALGAHEVLTPGDPVSTDQPLEAVVGAEPLRRLGAVMAVDQSGVLRGVLTVEQVRRALTTALP